MRHVSGFAVLQVTWIACGVQWTFPAEGAKILAVETIGGRSHWNFMSGVLRALTDAGHRVTAFTPFPDGNRDNNKEDRVTAFTPFPDGNRDNYEEVDTSGDIPVEEYNVLEVLNKSFRAITVFNDWMAFERDHCDRIYRNKRLGQIMNILDFIENSSHGVIYMSFGSRIKLNEFPEHVHEAFRDALSRVPQRVLWKYESEMKDKPKNVMTKKWFPQRDILLHPNVKLFISHGGMSVVYETVDAGVPLLGFPLFYDQPRNIEHLVDRKMAISLNLLTVTKETLLSAVNEIIKNDTYTINAKIASKMFIDRPMTPEQLVVYWTEYVIRHKGAPHLKSCAQNLTWYQYFLLDIIAVTIVFLFLLTVTVYTLFQLFCDYIRKNNLYSDKVKTQ